MSYPLRHPTMKCTLQKRNADGLNAGRKQERRVDNGNTKVNLPRRSENVLYFGSSMPFLVQ